jgi:2Fe-2S ferredoxin
MGDIAVKFVEADGSVYDAVGEEGQSVMQLAVKSGVTGVWAECGGMCACATCQCYVAPEWADALEPMTDMEDGMLTAAWQRSEYSRLTCQIKLNSALDGITFRVPAEQA